VAWEVFAVFYYGFPFPNTAYAKLFETGVTTAERVTHGLYYLQNSIHLDPLTLLAIAGGVVVGLTSSDRREAAVAIGVATYVGYVVVIGGDFVTGRFLTAPFVGAVVLLTRWPARPAVALGCCAVMMLAATLRGHDATLMDAHGVADERPYYSQVAVRDHPWAREGRAARVQHTPVVFRGDIGFFGFYAGPDVHIVDLWGLADPLIARLPARTDVAWRVGHYTRAIPSGYAETLASGRNQIGDRRIAALYDRLALITQAPLFDKARLLAIWNMNVGGGDAR
jgi:arabinofuranosyltransferase